jgi:hypothetical protein
MLDVSPVLESERLWECLEAALRATEKGGENRPCPVGGRRWRGGQ